MTDENRRPTPLPGENREGWMMFRYGGPLQLLDLKPEQVDVRDIIHGLSQINRFNGQTSNPIPVLWHSLMVMQLCAVHDRATRLEALFHDAGETYVGDWIRPLRSVFGDRLAKAPRDHPGDGLRGRGPARPVREAVGAGAARRQPDAALRDGVTLGLRTNRQLVRTALHGGNDEGPGGDHRDRRTARQPAPTGPDPYALPRTRPRARRRRGADTRVHRQRQERHAPALMNAPPEIDYRNRPEKRSE